MRYPTSTIHGNSSSRWSPTGISWPGRYVPTSWPGSAEIAFGDYETIEDWSWNALGRLPRRGDVIEDQGWKLRVRSTEGRRVGEVEITPVDGEEPDDGAG